MFSFPLHTHRLINSDLTDVESLDQFSEFFLDTRVKTILKIIIEKNGIEFFGESETKRLKQELAFFSAHNYLDIFLALEEVAFLYEEQDKIINIGRGKSGYCFLLYSLGLSKINSIKNNLSFIFFHSINNVRIEIDVPDQQGYQFLEKKYKSYFKRIEKETMGRADNSLRKAMDTPLSPSSKLGAALLSFYEKYHLKILAYSEKEIFEKIIEEETFIKDFFKKKPEKKNEALKYLDQKRKTIIPFSFVLKDIKTDLISYEESLNEVRISLIPSPRYRDLNERTTNSNLPRSGALQNLLGKSICEYGFKKTLEFENSVGVSFGKNLKLFSNKENINSIIELSNLLTISRVRSFNDFNKITSVFENKIKNYTEETWGYIIYQDQIIKILIDYLEVSLSTAIQIRSEMKYVLGEKTKYEDVKNQYKFSEKMDKEFFLFLCFANCQCVSRSHFIGEAYFNYYRINSSNSSNSVKSSSYSFCINHSRK